jgi:hypothetical protein
MKLHKHPLWYVFAPKWLHYFTVWLIARRLGEDSAHWWLMEGTPVPMGPPFIYQCLEGITWAMGWGYFSTVDDEAQE